MSEPILFPAMIDISVVLHVHVSPPSPLHSAPIAKDRFTKAAVVRVRRPTDRPAPSSLLPLSPPSSIDCCCQAGSVAILSDAGPRRRVRKKPFCTRVWSVAVEVRHSSIYPIAPPSMPLAVHPVNLLRSLPFKNALNAALASKHQSHFVANAVANPAPPPMADADDASTTRQWVQKDRRARSRQ